jgi:hypothetical protein
VNTATTIDRRNASAGGDSTKAGFFPAVKEAKMMKPMTTAKILGVVMWIACIVVSFGILQRYAATAGEARAPAHDAEALIARYRQPNHGLIVMAVHPECPCTDASLAELGDLLARSEGRCTALVLH